MSFSSSIFLVTRMPNQANDLCRLLNQNNVCAASFPIFVISPLSPSLPRYDHYDFGIFVSSYSVCNSSSLRDVPVTATHWLATGKGTAEAMAKYLPVETILFRDGYGGSDTVREILQGLPSFVKGKKTLLVRGKPTRPDLSQWLTERGVLLEEYVCYQRCVDDSWINRLLPFIDDFKEIIWVLTSTEVARTVCSSLQDTPFYNVSFSFLCSHPRIHDTVLEYGLGPVFLAAPDDNNLTDAIYNMSLSM
ncbi:uroporphyrinogen-III synthase [Candidatus Ichthyocystis hellenicum]|uniref:uroporphyrinogen-III synthase n=1 Tax=Candidatus Ichthyocystis hellenicum TaxID=1561003 RepID=UPI001584BFDB|nr:uroporphyrinogen-III synthase [Candidatus Ichthyocystis hellenicum]